VSGDKVLLTATAQNPGRLVRLLCRAPAPLAAARNRPLDINSLRRRVPPMILREHQIDEQGRMTVPTLIKLGDVLHIPARRTAAFVLANRPSQPRAF
jgi:hypothetical protein